MLTARHADASRAAAVDAHEQDAGPEPGWLGARPRGSATWFRVYAPQAAELAVVLEHGQAQLLARERDGYWSGRLDAVGAGALYRYGVDGRACPDPCSRFQPQGPHGPSMVVDDDAYEWHDAAWPGIAMAGQVIYELHVGTFTRDGTFDAAIAELPRLRELGITVLELMPVAEFAGARNWGYDGVALYAPFHGYGDHDALKRLVDAAHRAGIGVILDVVYNHLGPDGNYLGAYYPGYFTRRHTTDWGEGINFDGTGSAPVRDFFVRNARHWIRDFHLDGLRLDATQDIYDASPRHVLAEIADAARAAASPRSIILVGENEPQRAEALAPASAGGWGLDALWNDDFHHSTRVALTGRHDGYLHDHRGRAQELVAAARHGFLYQGQYYAWQRQPRGTPVEDLPAQAFVTFLENHDQVANTLDGARLCTFASAARLRALTALLLLAPQTPMLFMGQEYGSTRPFAFFADHRPELARTVRQGRRDFLRQFAPYATADAQARIADPADPATFEACKLDPAERARHPQALALHTDLLRLRRSDAVIAQQRREALDGAVLSMHCLVLRWRDRPHGDRLLVVNLAEDLDFRPAPEPLLAPPRARRWTLAWSSDAPVYGGPGAVDPCAADGWRIPGESAAFFIATATG